MRNGQTVSVEAIDAKGTAALRFEMGAAQGETMTLELTGQQYLDYALVSTTYSSQGKTADQVLTDMYVEQGGLVRRGIPRQIQFEALHR